LRANLALFVAIIVLILLAMFWIKLLNQKHAATRESMGKSAIVVDTSMDLRVKETQRKLRTRELVAWAIRRLTI
jgi:hypothetical protein